MTFLEMINDELKDLRGQTLTIAAIDLVLFIKHIRDSRFV